jgi:hypothetical protein
MTPAWRGFLDARRVVQLVALLLAIAAAVFLVFAPTGTGVTSSVDADGTVTTTEHAVTLLDVNGGGVLGVLLAPVVFTLVPALWVGRGRTVAAIAGTVLLGLLCVAGMMTIGVFYLPAALAAALAFVAKTRPAAAVGSTMPPPPTPRTA